MRPAGMPATAGPMSAETRTVLPSREVGRHDRLSRHSRRAARPPSDGQGSVEVGDREARRGDTRSRGCDRRSGASFQRDRRSGCDRDCDRRERFRLDERESGQHERARERAHPHPAARPLHEMQPALQCQPCAHDQQGESRTVQHPGGDYDFLPRKRSSSRRRNRRSSAADSPRSLTSCVSSSSGDP